MGISNLNTWAQEKADFLENNWNKGSRRLTKYEKYKAGRRKALKLAKDVGMPSNFTRVDIYKSVWDGKVLRAANDRSVSNIIHDIAHFQVSPKKYRNTAEFSLGISPDSHPHELPERPPGQSDQEEEERASILGILWEMYFGLRYRATAKEHNWTGWYGNGETAPILKSLYKYGLIDENLIPQRVVRK